MMKPRGFARKQTVATRSPRTKERTTDRCPGMDLNRRNREKGGGRKRWRRV
jgi:hypothetical protein